MFLFYSCILIHLIHRCVSLDVSFVNGRHGFHTRNANSNFCDRCRNQVITCANRFRINPETVLERHWANSFIRCLKTSQVQPPVSNGATEHAKAKESCLLAAGSHCHQCSASDITARFQSCVISIYSEPPPVTVAPPETPERFVAAPPKNIERLTQIIGSIPVAIPKSVPLPQVPLPILQPNSLPGIIPLPPPKHSVVAVPTQQPNSLPGIPLPQPKYTVVAVPTQQPKPLPRPLKNLPPQPKPLPQTSKRLPRPRFETPKNLILPLMPERKKATGNIENNNWIVADNINTATKRKGHARNWLDIIRWGWGG